MINKFKYSLNFKIFVVTTTLLFFVSFLTYYLIYRTLPNAYVQQIDHTTEHKAKQLLQDLENTSWEKSIKIIHTFEKQTGAQVYLIDSDDRLIKFSEDIEEGYRIVEPVKEYVPDMSIDSTIHNISSNSFQETTPEQILEFHFKFMNGEKLYQLLIEVNTISVHQFTMVFHKILPWNVLIILLVSLVFSYAYSRYITRPIISIEKAARRFAKMDFEVRCNTNRKDELGILSDSINEMSDNLSKALSELQVSNYKLQSDIEKERQLEEQRSLLFSSISHELKTPITVLQGQLDGMLHKVGEFGNRDKYLKRCLEITNSMEKTICEITILSRMEQQGFTPKKQHFDLTELLRQTIIMFLDLIEEKNLNLSVDLPQKITIMADKLLIEKAMANIISNAVFYTPREENITIKSWEDKQSIHISIANGGVTIPEDAIPRVFDSFYRVDTSRNKRTGGTGLGLYFVAKILEEHKFLYQIRNTNKGVEFTIKINLNNRTNILKK